MNTNKILVSVIVLTYGQVRYIKQAINSILEQKTNFVYEIIVGEDCSPDGTKDILKQYEKMHPQKFVMLYREQNLGINQNLVDALRRARGAYVAFCEGDDYWLDDNKLQRQVEFLIANSEYIAVAHNCQVVDRLGTNAQDISYFLCTEEEYSFKHYLQNIHPGQSATLVFKNYFNKHPEDLKLLELANPPDRMLCFLLRSRGRIRVFRNKMSAYRYVDTGNENWTARLINSKGFEVASLEQYKLMLLHAKKYFANNKDITFCAEKNFLCMHFLCLFIIDLLGMN